MVFLWESLMSGGVCESRVNQCFLDKKFKTTGLLISEIKEDCIPFFGF